MKRDSKPGGCFGWAWALVFLGTWGWIAYDFTRWIFPFAGGVRLAVLLLATPVAVILGFRLAHRGWKRARARLLATTPPPWPGRRELAALAAAGLLAAGLGWAPDAHLRRELERPRRLEVADSLGYRISLETRLGWWGIPYRFTISCPGPRPCRALYSFEFSLRDAETGERFGTESWLAPPYLAQPGSRWIREKRVHLVNPREYRRSRPVLRLYPLEPGSE